MNNLNNLGVAELDSSDLMAIDGGLVITGSMIAYGVCLAAGVAVGIWATS